jgi:hypothetical protein
MLVFGHAGITLGITLALGSQPPKFSAFTKRLDLRLLLFGSLLPDIIDKPLGHLLFRETLNNGRLVGHTLVFLLILSLAGHLLYRRGHLWLLTLAIGSFWHLVFDWMWLDSRTLLWPLFGTSFERLAIDNLLAHWFYSLISNPAVYIPEIIGVLTLAWFGLHLLQKRSLLPFLKYGKTGSTS